MVVEQTSKTLFLFIFLVALQYSPCITTTIAQNTSTSQLEKVLCNSSNRPTNRSFQKYLDEAIENLKSSANSSLHFNYYSPIPDYTRTVHTSYLCQNDITSTCCYGCVTRAAETAKSKCSNWSMEAVVYEDECTFRYSNNPYYGRFDDSPRNYSYYEPVNLNSVNASLFGQVLNRTVVAIEKNLRSKSNYSAKFATKEAKVDDKTKIYAMGECTWDLYHEDCRLCIHECALNLTAGKLLVGGRVMLPSCNFRYQTNPFYPDAPPSGPSDGQTPPPHPPPPPSKLKKPYPKAKVAEAGAGAGAAGMLIGGTLAWAYQERKITQLTSADDLPEDTEAGPDSPAEDPEDPGVPAGGGDLPPDSETKEGSGQVNDEESERRRRRPAFKQSKGAKNNTRKKPPPRR